MQAIEQTLKHIFITSYQGTVFHYQGLLLIKLMHFHSYSHTYSYSDHEKGQEDENLKEEFDF